MLLNYFTTLVIRTYFFLSTTVHNAITVSIKSSEVMFPASLGLKGSMFDIINQPTETKFLISKVFYTLHPTP